MATRNRSTVQTVPAVKHGAVYAPFRKALEALGDGRHEFGIGWMRSVTFPNLPDVGTNWCWACHSSDVYTHRDHIDAPGCRRYIAPAVA